MLNPISRDKLPEFMADIKAYLRRCAPNVKKFVVDVDFRGYITTYERGGGENTFVNFEELKKYYGVQS